MLLIVMGAGVVLGMLLGFGSDFVEDPEWLGTAGGVLVVASLLAPLWAAAVLGGYAIHRFGWIPGFLLGPAVANLVLAVVAGETWWVAAGVGALTVLVLSFFVLGGAGGVPMWLTFPLGRRSVTISEGDPERRARQQRGRREPGD
ncbi:hypothetical protein [Georgenia yuyongxinii]